MTSRLPPARRVRSNGIALSVHEAGRGLPVVLAHGFPELAFSWRHQIAPLVAAGCRVIAPDLRGYGATGSQGDVEAYRMSNLAKDLTGLLDALDLPRAVFVGHDFGGALVWSVARDHPERVLGVVALNTPYTRRAPVDLLQAVRQTHGDSHYMQTFQQPGVGEALLGDDVEATFRGLMRRPGMKLGAFARAPERLRALPASAFGHEPALWGEAFLDEQELAVFVDAYRKTGFEGGLNWYRNLRRNWLETEGSPDKVSAPALMISAADDFFLPPHTTRDMERHVPDLERHVSANCGHWTQQERPEEVNALICEWLSRRDFRAVS
jgi:pimeloyl-ACP methyl ester carboxylesterase